MLPLSWRWVPQCRKLNVTLKLTVSFHMLQIHRYLKADGECPNVTNSLLPQSWRWVSKCRNFILHLSWRWVFRCRKFIATSKLTVSVQMPQIHFTCKLTVSVQMPQILCYLKADGDCSNKANSLLPQSWRWVFQCRFHTCCTRTWSSAVDWRTARATQGQPRRLVYVVMTPRCKYTSRRCCLQWIDKLNVVLFGVFFFNLYNWNYMDF